MNLSEYNELTLKMITETPKAREERLAEKREEARIENLEYEEECRESRTDYEHGAFHSGTSDKVFL